MKYFSVPGYFEFFNQIRLVTEYRELHPDYFYSDRIIDSSYDFLPGLIWNGGRIQPFHTFDERKLIAVQSYYHDSPIKMRHVCTNQLLTPELLLDWQSNLWLQVNEKEGNGVIVASDLLEEYVKEKYPKYEIITSTTCGITDPDKANELSAQHLFVVNYNMNNNNAYLSLLKHPENCEILCAEPCPANCANRANHYADISRKHLWIDLDIPEPCPNRDRMPYNFYDVQRMPNAVTNERVDELAKMGFQYFKISGRQSPIHNWYEMIIYYLILPEYRDRVRQDLLNIEYNVLLLQDTNWVPFT